MDLRDVVAYLNVWADGGILADWDYDAAVDVRDFIAFLAAWLNGC